MIKHIEWTTTVIFLTWSSLIVFVYVSKALFNSAFLIHIYVIVPTAVQLGHDRTTICEKNANLDDRSTIVYVDRSKVVSRSCWGLQDREERGQLWKFSKQSWCGRGEI